MNMSWTDDLEKRKLYEWACKHSEEFHFTEIDKRKDTYYETFDNVDNVCEFGFGSVPELVEELDKLWEGQAVFDFVKKICAVAAFKREPVLEDSSKKEEQGLIEIPEFVYTF